MAAVTRLGLYGGSRGLYGSFAGKVAGVPVVPTKGGRRKRRRYIVEVDGQFFEVSNIAEAQSVLSQIREIAEVSAEKDVRPGVTVKPPRVSIKTVLGKPVTSKVLKASVQDTQKAIIRIYRKAQESLQRDLEIGRLFKKQLDQEDDDDAIALLLL